MNVAIEPLSADLWRAFAGDDVPPLTIRGYAVTHDGRPVAVGGYSHQQGHTVLFSDLGSHEARPMSIWRCAKKVMALAAASPLPVVAFRSEDEPTADAFLKRLGFVEDGEVYRWHI